MQKLEQKINSEIIMTNIADGIELVTIEDKKHNTNRISINLCIDINEEDVSANAILPFLLSRATNKYKTTIELQKRLSELYGASIYSDVRKLGKTQILTISVSAVDNRFALDDENILKECADILIEILFNPLLNNGKLDENLINQEKRCLIELIESELNEKRLYAINKCQQIMFDGTPYAINKYGSAEKVEALNADIILKEWNNVLKNSRVIIMAVGESNTELLTDIFSKEFKKISRNNIKNDTIISAKRTSKINEVTERMNVNQAKLVMGFSVDKKGDDSFPETVMTALFGGTPHSRLFLNVREKKSLCYYCAASFDKYKRMLLVDCGLEEKDKDEALEEILKQLEIIKNGEFELPELDFAKLSLINSFKTAADYQSSLEGYYLSQIAGEKIITLKEAADKINNVTKQDVIEAASRVTLDTIYLLSGKVEEDI